MDQKEDHVQSALTTLIGVVLSGSKGDRGIEELRNLLGGMDGPVSRGSKRRGSRAPLVLKTTNMGLQRDVDQ